MAIQFNHKKSSESTPVYIPGKPHPIGQIVNETFRKTGVVFHKLDAFAVESSLIPQLKKAGVAFLQIKDKESGLVYSIQFEEFLKHGQPIDEGWGKQLACPRKYFRASGQEQLRLVTD